MAQDLKFSPGVGFGPPTKVIALRDDVAAPDGTMMKVGQSFDMPKQMALDAARHGAVQIAPLVSAKAEKAPEKKDLTPNG